MYKSFFHRIFPNIPKRNSQKGFTLIELLVVIAIVALLSSVIMAGLQSARSRARDSKRVQEARTIEKALSLYALDNGGYVPKSNYTTINGVGANVVPKKPDGTIDCDLNRENTESLYDILVPDYLSARPNDDPLENLGYCYVYVSGGDVIYTAGAEYDTSGVLVSPKVKLATIEGSTKNKASVFFAASENILTNTGNNALVGVSYGSTPPVQLNVDLTTGIRSNTAYDQAVGGDVITNPGNGGGNGGTCPANSTRQNGVCTCSSGYTMTNGACVLDELTCPLNEYDNGMGSCQCDEGYTRDEGGTCQMDVLVCGENQYDDGFGSCQCNEGYAWNSDTSMCEYVVVCGENQYDDGTGMCVCNEGFHMEGDVCVQDPVCGVNKYYNGGGCVCNDGYVPDVAGDNCHYPPNCLANEQEDGYGNCECMGGYQRDGSGMCTLIVITCGENEQNISDVCTCVSGYERDVSGVCVQIVSCPENQHLDGSGMCACNDGYLSNGIGGCEAILTCGENSHQEGSACVCNEGYEGDGTSCTMIPQCGSNQIPMNGTCVCAEGYQWDGYACSPPIVNTCDEGYTWNGSYCEYTYYYNP